MKFHAVALLLTLGACSSALPAPPKAIHPLAAFSTVPYPPPAALAEVVPDEPNRAGVVWIDGEWVLHGSSFVWRRGSWVLPPTGARFAPWQTWYRRDGRLMHAPGTWYDGKNERVRRPESVIPAQTPANEITSEFQTGR